MLLREHKDLKIAIIAIPPKEKDKLLLRLIAKDKVLTEHLHFKLLEDEQDLDRRHELLKEEIQQAMELVKNKQLSAKEVLPVVRKLNGKISHHYKVTRALNSEVELRIYLLNHTPLVFKEGIFSPLYKYNEKLMIYLVKTTISTLSKYKKLHEDLQFDLKADFNQLLISIYTSKLAGMAQEQGLVKEV